MATKAALRTLLPAASIARPCARTSTRPFITFPGTEVQSLSATRILPYKSTDLYKIISDVDSYSFFLPYCQQSKVTKWSAPDNDGNRWPSEADLKVGWGGYEETYTSKLLCIPGSIVEALGGEAKTTIPRADVQHHGATYDAPASSSAIFTSLLTRWEVKPFHYKPQSGLSQTSIAVQPPIFQTEVNLNIEFQFANPMYAALSKAVAPKVAGIMIEAFEARAKQLLDSSGADV